MPNRMDSLISTGMGKMKGVKARLEGLTGVFRTLAEQHGEVIALMERVRSNADKRTDLWPTIRKELLSHERGEVREVFPVLREYDETRQLADHHDEEASEMEALIDQLDAADIQSDAWGETFRQLLDIVRHHANEEEDQIFPAAQRVIGEPRAKQLETTFLQAKKKIAEAT